MQRGTQPTIDRRRLVGDALTLLGIAVVLVALIRAANPST